MADNNFQLEGQFSLEKLISELQQARAEAVKMANDFAQTNKQIKEGFEQVAGAANSMVGELSDAKGKISGLEQTIADLRTELDAYKKSASASTGTLSTDFTRASGSADQLRTKIAALKVSQSELRSEITKAKQEIKNNEAEANKLVATYGKLLNQNPQLKKAYDDLIAKNESLRQSLIDTQKRIDANGTAISGYNKELGNLGKKTEEAIEKGDRFTKVLSGAWSILRRAAYILPGFGIAGLLGLAIEPLISLFNRLKESFFGLTEAQKAQKDLEKAYSDIQQETIKNYTKQASQVELLRRIINDQKMPLQDRNNALREYNELADKANRIDVSQIDNISLVNQKISQQIQLIQERALARASENIIAQRAEVLLLAQEKARTKALQDQQAELQNGRILTVNGKGGQAAIDYVRQQELKADVERRVREDKEVKDAQKQLDLATQTALKLIRIEGFAGDRIKEIKDKRVKDTADRNSQILALEKQLADTLAQLYANPRLIEIQQENARYEATIRAMEVLKKQKGVTQREIELANQIEEAQLRLHYKKLRDIDDKYYTEAFKALKEAQEQINGLLLKGKEKDLHDIEAKYEKIAKVIQNAAKKMSIAFDNNPTVNQSVFLLLATQQKQLAEQKAKDIAAVNLKYGLETLKKNEELEKAGADLITVSGIHEERLTTLKEAIKLNITIEYAKKRLALLKASGDKENEVQIAQLEALIKDSSKKLGELKEKYQHKDLFEALGISEVDEKKIKGYAATLSKFGEVTKNALQPFIDLMDTQINKRKELIDAIDESISKQQEAVDKEKELMEKGYANNYAMEQKRLKDLQKQKDQELEQEKKLQKEKATLQKAQIVADTISQSSNLITAASEIYESFAALPFGAGIPLAYATIGIMLGGFIASKVAAFKAVNQASKFENGGTYDILKGRASHKERGVVLMERKTGQELAEFEGDEKLFIVNKGSSRKYEPLLDAINKDELSNWTYEDLKNYINPVNIEFDRSKVAHLLPNNQTNITVIQPQQNNLSEAYLKDIAATNRKLLESEQEKETWTELSDRIIYKKGNMQRIIWKKKEEGAS